MPINKRSLGLVRKELHEQRAGLGLCKTLNPDGVTWIHKQRHPATFGMRLDHRMNLGLQGLIRVPNRH